MTIDFGLPLFSFDLVVIDCPWPWATWSAAGQGKSPQAHYDVMSMDDIAALRVGDLLAPAGVLVMWATWPLIERQAGVMRRWGLKPVTGGAWAKRTASGKLRWGTGYVLRSVCEPFLVGALPGAAIAMGRCMNLVETLDHAAVDGIAREHSRKPEEFYALTEALVPDGRRADIFAREDRPGWTCWGNEVGKFAGAEVAQ
ncbi:MT-A70 family methyltransferase [Aurantimonas sp. VKM B-3413]|uniref:MT-A70 family methyltransferase n=1 Tax=Aurantimonas sp. VKM B-3413 TaxID=2779401 RepID=UPI001E6366F7|nr:MT-A70 family methyltransferase [Aurantimonas sp. VKM B-3413]MCB8835958.1 DNA methyltransferase [Aurantimonas sp. VKM B-3413]